MKKVRRILGIIVILLLVINVGVVIFFGFIYKGTKVQFDPTLRVDPNYQWVLANLNKEVEEKIVDLNNDLITNEFITLIREETVEYKDSPIMRYPIYSSDKKLYINLSLSDNHSIDVVMISPNTNAFKFHIRSAGSYDQKVIDYSELPNGQYHIFVVDNEEKYDTTYYLSIK